jgi:hypothetical protein
MSEPDQLSSANQAAVQRAVVPEYPDILEGVGSLRFLARIVTVVGGVIAALGVLCIVLFVVGVVSDWKGMPVAAGALATAGVAMLLNGVVLLMGASAVNMLAAVSLAVRDMARNSFPRR